MTATVTLALLKKSLDSLKGQADVRRKEISARLAAKQPVTAEEEEWLDNAANFVDEDLLVDHLEKASSFDTALAGAQADPTKAKAFQALLENGMDNGQLKANRCSIDSLLNPEGESEMPSFATDEDIFLAVTEMKDHDNGLAMTEDDPDDPPPSRKDALAAAAVLQGYLRTLDLGDPKLESLSSLGSKLSLFGHQTRREATQTMEDGDITKFFARK